jgi:integrase/recombinase XerC
MMTLAVVATEGSWRLEGGWSGVGPTNVFLAHLGTRGFATATVRAYAYDLLNFGRFCNEQGLQLAQIVPADVFAWIDWQMTSSTRSDTVVRFQRRGAAPSTVNRRTAAVRALFEHQLMLGLLATNPVPAPRRGQGLRPKARGMLGHLGPGRPRGGGKLVREPRRLPEALDPEDVTTFLTDLRTHRDRALVLAMLLGGLRAGEVRRLRLADVDFGRRLLTVIGKGDRQRVVPVDRTFFVELAAYLRTERPGGSRTPECFVVLHGPTTGSAMTEAGMRSLFRHHRQTSGAVRVRPHRLRHTYGTELAAAGIDLLVLRELMGHVSPETTAGYVHLSPEHLAAEYAAARAVMG